MTPTLRLLAATALLLALPASAGPASPVPPVYLERTVPDLLQTDPAFGLAANGDQYCGPVAVSNSLLWLAGQGRPALAPGQDARALLTEISSARFMDTDPRTGTGPGALMKGLSAYLLSRGFPEHRIAYQGWRRVPSRFDTGTRVPGLDDARRTLAEGGAAWLHVGWYRRTGQGEFTRAHGHWLTLVGYGADRSGVPNERGVVVHDPSPRAGIGPSSQYLELVELDSGTLTGRYHGLPRTARGYHTLGGELRLPTKIDAAILDGVVHLSLD